MVWAGPSLADLDGSKASTKQKIGDGDAQPRPATGRRAGMRGYDGDVASRDTGTAAEGRAPPCRVRPGLRPPITHGVVQLRDGPGGIGGEIDQRVRQAGA